MVEKKIPVSLNKTDYAFLNHIQQGLLYSGSSITGVFDFSDILKACVLHSSLKIIEEWGRDGRKIVEGFLNEIGIENTEVPDSLGEIFHEKKLDQNMRIAKLFIDRNEPIKSTLNDLLEQFGTEPVGTGTMRESGVSNLILKLNEDEINLFEKLKQILEQFKKSSISYSEMTKVLFRNLIINVPINNSDKQEERLTLLTAFYISGVYGFSALESTLLLHRSVGGNDTPKLSKTGLETLSHIYRDETLFKIYITEMRNNLDNERATQPFSLNFPDNVKSAPRLFNISQNKFLDEKYRSSVVNSVGFHSVFLGYVLLMMEWLWDQHKLPLLVTYLTAKSDTEYSFVHTHTVQALDRFEAGVKDLFSFSKEYRDNLNKF